MKLEGCVLRWDWEKESSMTPLRIKRSELTMKRLTEASEDSCVVSASVKESESRTMTSGRLKERRALLCPSDELVLRLESLLLLLLLCELELTFESLDYHRIIRQFC